MIKTRLVKVKIIENEEITMTMTKIMIDKNINKNGQNHNVDKKNENC